MDSFSNADVISLQIGFKRAEIRKSGIQRLVSNQRPSPLWERSCTDTYGERRIPLECVGGGSCRECLVGIGAMAVIPAKAVISAFLGFLVSPE